MKIYYRHYKLHALKDANRLSSQGPKSGVHFKVNIRGGENFGDYFPHIELGDKTVEEFLEKFKYQDQEYEQKVFHFLLNEHNLRTQKAQVFLNHELWDGGRQINSPVIKYKLKDKDDFRFLSALKNKIIVRLDANGTFKKEEILPYFKDCGDSSMIDYMEDPSIDPDWSDLPVAAARDFIEGSPYRAYIHKPSARFFPKDEKMVIFSSYMGSDLGSWQSYCELLEKGNLEFYHGIITCGLYQEELPLFKGSYLEGFRPEESTIRAMYNELSLAGWKVLCAI